MSSRARIVPSAAIERFDWNATATQKPVSQQSLVDPAKLAQAQAAVAPVAAASLEQVRLENQAHLAALEREAFAKGYAQGERAGIEAGGKRAEAMLRRVAQTLTDLSGLRDTLIQQTERQMVQLALTIARRIVLREVTLDPELIAA